MSRSFNGTNQGIDTTFAGFSGNLTIACWVYPTNIGAAFQSMFCGTSTITIDFQLKQTSNVVAIAQNQVVEIVHGNTALSNNTWYHVACTYNTSTNLGQIYVNGGLDNSNTQAASTNGASNYSMGYNPHTPSQWFPGRLADVSAWGVILTVPEIQGLARGERPYLIRRPSLVGWWPTDGLQSPEPDLSGNAHNGTLVNAPVLAFGPPIGPFTPRWPVAAPPAAAPASSIVFRRSLSELGTRAGSRQMHS